MDILPPSTPTRRIMIFRATLLLAALTVLAGAAPLHPQDLSFRAGVGTAIPVGGAGERRDAGPAVMLSVETRLSRLWGLRLDWEWSLLNGPTAPSEQENYSNYQDLRTVGVSLNGIFWFSDGQIAPYWLIGIGAYRLQRVDAPASPYGTTGAFQAGFGIDAAVWERFSPFAEARAQVHITDYGSDEFSPTVYWPVLIGLRIR